MTSLENPPAPTATALPPQRRHLAIGTLLTTGALVVPLAASAVLSLVIARLYGPSRTGVMSLVMNLADVALQIFTLGLGAGITYLVSRGEWPLRRAWPDLRRVAAGLGIAGALCGLGFYALTRHTVLRGVTPALAIISLASLPFSIAWAFAAAAALGRDRYEAYAVLEITSSAVLMVVGVVLAILWGLIGAVIGFTAANIMAAIAASTWVRRERRREPAAPDHQSGSGDELRRATRFGLQSWSANLLQLLNYRLDLFILSAVAARSAVGVYAIAVSITALGWVLPNAFQTVLFPRVASLDASAEAGQISSEASDAAAARAVRHSILMTGPTMVALVALVLLVPLIYGHSFHRSIGLGLILIPGVAGLGVAKVMSAVFSGRGFPRYAFYITAITVPLTVALYLLLIPQLDAVGAALASTISYLISLVLSGIYFKRATAIPLRRALIPVRSDVIDYVHAFRLAHARVRRA